MSYLCKYDDSPKKEEDTQELIRYNENVLRIYNKNLFYKGWIDEGITIEAMQKFEISYDMLHNRIIIPHRYVDYKLIGIKTRYINNDDIKYVPLSHNGVTYRYPTGLNLYGLYRNWRTIKKKKKVVIFEGGISPVSVLPHAKRGQVYNLANGQLNRKIKVVREPKSILDMVIPWEDIFRLFLF